MKSVIACLALPLLIAGCGVSAPKPAMYCPKPAVLQQAAQMTQFLPGRADIAGQVISARITGVAGSCDSHAKGMNVVSFQIGFAATRGPAGTAQAQPLQYFVSIVNGDTIVSKSIYGIDFKYDGTADQAVATTKTIKVDAPNMPQSADEQILVGFQMTPAELSYAQSHPAGP